MMIRISEIEKREIELTIYRCFPFFVFTTATVNVPMAAKRQNKTCCFCALNGVTTCERASCFNCSALKACWMWNEWMCKRAMQGIPFQFWFEIQIEVIRTLWYARFQFKMKMEDLWFAGNQYFRYRIIFLVFSVYLVARKDGMMIGKLVEMIFFFFMREERTL